MSAALDEADRLARPQSPEQRARVDAAARAVAAQRRRVRADAYAAADQYLIDPRSQPCTLMCDASQRADLSAPGSSCSCERVGVRYGDDNGPRAVVIPCTPREARDESAIAEALRRRDIDCDEASERLRLHHENRSPFAHYKLDTTTKETPMKTTPITTEEMIDDAARHVATEAHAMESFLAKGAPPKPHRELSAVARMPLPPEPPRPRFDARDIPSARADAEAMIVARRDGQRARAEKTAIAFGSGSRR